MIYLVYTKYNEKARPISYKQPKQPMDQIVGSGAVDTLSLPKVKDSLAEAIVGLIRWFTKNWANTHEPTHKDLAPISLPLPLDASIELVKTKVSEMPRWKVEES